MRRHDAFYIGGKWTASGGARTQVRGYKKSGLGRELGSYGLEEFLEVKSIQR